MKQHFPGHHQLSEATMREDQTTFAPWGTVSPAFWRTASSPSVGELTLPLAGPGPGSAQPPAEYRERIASVTATFTPPHDPHKLAAAVSEAESLDQELSTRCGPEHPQTSNIRELRGWLAHLMGQHAVATRLYLHAIGLQKAIWGTGHRITQESAQRAAHTWSRIVDPQEALALGPELLSTLVAVAGEDSQASPASTATATCASSTARRS